MTKPPVPVLSAVLRVDLRSDPLPHFLFACSQTTVLWIRTYIHNRTASLSPSAVTAKTTESLLLQGRIQDFWKEALYRKVWGGRFATETKLFHFHMIFKNAGGGGVGEGGSSEPPKPPLDPPLGPRLATVSWGMRFSVTRSTSCKLL